MKRVLLALALLPTALLAQDTFEEKLAYARHLQYPKYPSGNGCEPREVKRIAGTAKDASGAPAPGTAVAVFREGDHRRVCTTLADSNSRFDCGALPVGRYRLVYGQFKVSDIPLHLTSQAGKPLKLFLPLPGEEVVLACPSGLIVEDERDAKELAEKQAFIDSNRAICDSQTASKIAGTVKSAKTDEEVEAVSIAVFRNSDGKRVCTTFSDYEGSFRCQKLPDDNYRVVFADPKFHSVEIPVFLSGGAAGSLEIKVVDENATATCH